jgi:hypothetical protein
MRSTVLAGRVMAAIEAASTPVKSGSRVWARCSSMKRNGSIAIQ